MIEANLFVVAERQGFAAPLQQIAREAGVALSAAYSGLDYVYQQAPRSPLNLFLLAEVPNPVVLGPVLSQIRGSGRREVRFAPLIYCAESPSAATVALCTALGFDDVMAAPFAPKRLAERIERQLNRPIDYVQTPTYFGPARQRADQRRKGLGPNGRPLAPGRVFAISRSPEAGVRILSEHQIARPQTVKAA